MNFYTIIAQSILNRVKMISIISFWYTVNYVPGTLLGTFMDVIVFISHNGSASEVVIIVSIIQRGKLSFIKGR